MPRGSTDSEIISQVLTGDQQAYALLVSRYQDYVFTLVVRMIKSREDAEEIAQDIFIKAYRCLADFRGDSKFSTWLYTIVHTSCLTFLRKKKQWLQSLDEEHVFDRVNERESGLLANTVEQKSRHGMVNQAITLLNPDDSLLITLFYKAEQTLEEIAQILGIEGNAVKVRLYRARARLKEKMETHFAQEIKDLNTY